MESGENKRLRYAIYTRFSAEMQNEISLEDQESVCRQTVAERGGVVVQVFRDSARSGWSLDRDGFNQMRAAAEHGKFDALMVWKFDRLARNHEHSVMIKMLLRHEHGLKLHCVEGVSEDDDDSPYSAFMEQMLAVFSAFYSRNLSSETRRAKRQRAMRGEFNGSRAPLGYILVTREMSTPDQPMGLLIDPDIGPVVQEAFARYRTGKYTDPMVADWMNEQPAIQALRRNRQPMSKDTVRDVLQNRIYTGRVPYSETEYNGTLGEGKKGTRGRRTWFEGNHDALISDDVYDDCVEVRKAMGSNNRAPDERRVYILGDRVFCAECLATKPSALIDNRYGKMRPFWHKSNRVGYYRCSARVRGYEPCGQGFAVVEQVDDEVVAILSNLVIPDDVKQRIEAKLRSNIEHEAALARMEEIKEVIERIDFRWDHGFLGQEEYVEKRRQLQLEMESLRPIDYDALIEAADLLENFKKHWDACQTAEKPAVACQQLLRRMVERVLVYDGAVLGIILYGDFRVFVRQEESVPCEIGSRLRERGYELVFGP